MKNMAVFAILRDGQHAEAGVKALIDSGFREEDISALMAQNVGTKDFAHERHSKAPEGTALGALLGLLTGGAFGWLLAMGTIVIPSLAPYVANGPLMCALAGVGAGGVLGGIAGMLIGLGIPEFEAKRYAGLIKEGRSLLSVHCDSAEWASRAKNVLKSAGAQHIVPASESTAGFAASNKPYIRFRNAHGSFR
jgi:hypothetical protein